MSELRRISFATGRVYNRPQILEIAFIPPTQKEIDDDFSRFSTVYFVDNSRNISGTCEMLGAFLATDSDNAIGRDLLHAYDCGHYVSR